MCTRDSANTAAPGKEMVNALTASLKARLASLNGALTTQNGPVSYTHLDVYKRQAPVPSWPIRSDYVVITRRQLCGQCPHFPERTLDTLSARQCVFH